MSVKRNTVQRQIILGILKEFTSHPSVDTLYAAISEKHPTISKATVYRNLHHLSEEGAIAQMAVFDDVSRYDGRADVHYHFACKKCNEIFDLEIDCIKGIDEMVQASYGVKVDKHEILFSGVCKKCCNTKHFYA